MINGGLVGSSNPAFLSCSTPGMVAHPICALLYLPSHPAARSTSTHPVCSCACFFLLPLTSFGNSSQPRITGMTTTRPGPFHVEAQFK